MIHYIIASHKYLAEGFYSAIQAIVGEVAHVHIISAYVDHNDVALQINSCLAKIGEQDEIIVMSDIYGGSVNNEWMKQLKKRKFHLIAGVNLALIMSIMVEVQEVSKEILLQKIEASKESIRYCNDDVLCDGLEEDF